MLGVKTKKKGFTSRTLPSVTAQRQMRHRRQQFHARQQFSGFIADCVAVQSKHVVPF